jgi:hypothetical protein
MGRKHLMAESTGFSGKYWSSVEFHLSRPAPKGICSVKMPIHREREFIWGKGPSDIEDHIDYLAGPDGPFAERGYVVEDIRYVTYPEGTRRHQRTAASTFLISTR